MTTRSRTTDRELILILITLFMLAFATRFVDAGSEEVRAAFATPIASIRSASLDRLDAATNPYWAPAHSFSRRLDPVYSDATTTTESSTIPE